MSPDRNRSIAGVFGRLQMGRLMKGSAVVWIVGVVSLAFFAWAAFERNYYAFAVAAACVAYFLVRVARWQRRKSATADALPADLARTGSSSVAAETPEEVDDLVGQMLVQGRYGLLLRPELVSNLADGQFDRAWDMLEEEMAIVPDGEIVIGRLDPSMKPLDEDGDEEDAEPSDGLDSGTVVRVEFFFLDRYPVTNRRYYEFVKAGGYEQMAIWDPEIWPGVLDFVDSTGHPGPRYWKNGKYLSGQEDHPVVGVCWYEAAAYARWVGKRLPTDPEWEKAASWPTQLSASAPHQRKYPWGDTMDRARCNLWGSGPSQTCSVHEYEQGVSVGGIHHLTGNVWEWTTGNFGAWSFPSRDLILPVPMKSIRGGAFDTYFDNHATCQFQSGEDPVQRRHNIGFRCGISVCDLALRDAAGNVVENATRDGADRHEPVRVSREDAHAVEEVPV